MRWANGMSRERFYETFLAHRSELIADTMSITIDWHDRCVSILIVLLESLAPHRVMTDSMCFSRREQKSDQSTRTSKYFLSSA